MFGRFRMARKLRRAAQADLANQTRLLTNLVVRQRSELLQLHAEVRELSRRIAHFPQPLRANWTRVTGPAWERETLSLPAPRANNAPPRRASDRLSSVTLVPLRPSPPIGRVTIQMLKTGQIVTVYDVEGNKIPRLCGQFKDVGLKVMELAGKLEWDVVGAAA